MGLPSYSNVLVGAKLLSSSLMAPKTFTYMGVQLPCGHGNTPLHQLEGSNSPVPLQGTHQPTGTAGRAFLTAKGLCWEEEKLQWMLGKEGQTQCPRHFWRTRLLDQWPLLFIQRDQAQASPKTLCWVLGHSCPPVL